MSTNNDNGIVYIKMDASEMDNVRSKCCSVNDLIGMLLSRDHTALKNNIPPAAYNILIDNILKQPERTQLVANR